MDQKAFQYFKPLIQKEIAENHIAGAQIGIYHNEEEVFKENYGMANLEKNQPMEDGAIFRLYSMSKPVATVAAMILYERGMLDLEAPVYDYLPAFKEMKVWNKEGSVKCLRPITIKDLFSMTSGLVYPDQDEVGQAMQGLFDYIHKRIEGNRPMTTQEVIGAIASRPLAFEPGERWRYGLSVDVIGAIIEAISGKQLGHFYKEELFEPLGMKDTDFYVPKEKHTQLVELYYQDQTQGECTLKIDEKRHLGLTKCLTPPAFESAGAGLLSTLTDYSKFAMMLAQGGTYKKVRVLGENTVDLITQNQLSAAQLATVDFDQLKGYGYGYFMRILMDLEKASSNGKVGEFGWDGWTGPYVTISRKDHLVFMYMTQVSGYCNWRLMRALRAIVYSAF